MARAAASAPRPWSSDARTVCAVIGTAGTKEGLALAREHGAHHVLNHRDANYLQQVLPLTGGAGVDVVLEMLANVNLDNDLDVLARNGRVVVIGNRGRVEIDPRKAMARDGAILGMTLFNATPEELREIHAGLVAGLENGTLNPVIGKEFAAGRRGEGACRGHGVRRRIRKDRPGAVTNRTSHRGPQVCGSISSSVTATRWSWSAR